MDLNLIKNIPLFSYLASLGFKPKSQSGNRFFYTSPFKLEEKTPSFAIRIKENDFKCFATGFSGDVIQFVMVYEHIDFKEAIEKLKQFEPTEFQEIPETKEETKTEIRSIDDIKSKGLYWYLNHRKINAKTAKIYLKEVHCLTNDKYKSYWLGFQNDTGGWELSRNNDNPKKRKRSISPKTITTIKGENKQSVMIFEGFFDFLSYLTMQHIEVPKYDTIVLNSVSNLEKAFDLLVNYQTVFLILDNDDTGRNAVDKIKNKHPNINDLSNRYVGFKDLNECLMNQKSAI